MPNTEQAEKTFPVVEMFGPTIQGEGTVAGMRSHFVRFGYCDALPTGICSWCDSRHAADARNKHTWRQMTAREIAEKLIAFGLGAGVQRVTLTGGNPAIHDLSELVDLLYGWSIWVETQGTLYRGWMDRCNVTFSPKPPSAGRCDLDRFVRVYDSRMDAVAYSENPQYTAVKIPVDPQFHGDAGEEADLEFAVQTFDRLDRHPASEMTDYHLSVVTYPQDAPGDVIARWKAVCEWALEEPRLPDDVKILPQLHVLLWGHELGR